MRLAIWTSTMNMIFNNLFFGVGWGFYWFYYPRYDYLLRSASLQVFHAHNTYLHYAAEIGIFGALAYVFLIILHCSQVFFYREDLKEKILYLSVSCGIFSFSILNLTDHLLFNGKLSMLFWVLLGFLGAKLTNTRIKKSRRCVRQII